MKKIFFFDRDGVINEDIGYCHKIDDFKFIENSISIMKYIISSGFEIIIVTNQSGIGRGLYSEEDFHILNNWMKKELLVRGIELLDVLYCPHTPDNNCSCRKPKPGLIIAACKKYNIDCKNSWLIGDKERDIISGIKSEINNTVLFENSKDRNIKTKARFTIHSLNEIKNLGIDK